jgi:hypothetical protein
VLYTFLTKEKPAGPITVRSGNSNTMDMFKKLGKYSPVGNIGDGWRLEE